MVDHAEPQSSILKLSSKQHKKYDIGSSAHSTDGHIAREYPLMMVVLMDPKLFRMDHQFP